MFARIISFALITSFMVIPSSYSGDFMDLSTVKLEKWLAEQGIYSDFSLESWENLGDFLNEKIAQEEEKNSVEGEGPDQDLIRGLTGLRTIYLGRETLTEFEKQQIYPSLYRALAGQYEEMLKLILWAPQTFGRFIFWNKVRLPYIDEDHRDNPLEELAKNEAKNLIMNGAQSYASVKQLSKLTPDQVSQLEISKSHAVWLTEDQKSQRGDALKQLETRFQEQINKLEETQKAVKALGMYKFDFARNVLFFEEMKDTATSAKISVKDAYGMKWKLKIGAEEQTEPVVNELYLMAGGRYSDIVYAHHYLSTAQILILDKPDTDEKYPTSNEEFKIGCKRAITFEELVTCYKKSKYHARLEPFVLEHGVVTEENYPILFGKIPGPWRDSDWFKNKTIGREYVIYKENSLEFQGDKDFLLRMGPYDQNSMGNLDDRVSRGLGVFNLWIKNKDAKVENNKSFLSMNSAGEWDLWETSHDLGASLGGFLYEGRINSLKVDEDFVKIKDPIFSKKEYLDYPAMLIFVPKVWKKATFADQKWMARQIVSLSQDQIKKAVAKSLWPDFMQETLSTKLILRRNRLAEIYGLTDLLESNPAPKLKTITVRMNTQKERSSAAAKYGIRLKDLEQALVREGELDEENSKSEYVDRPIEDGKVNSCKESLLIGMMEDQSWPSGLSRRAIRLISDGTLRQCKFDP